MEYLVITLGLLLIYAYWKRRYNSFLQTEFELKMYGLQTKLLHLSNTGKLDKNNWLYVHFDNLFSKLANESYFLTYPFFIFSSKRNENNREEIEAFREFFNAELNKHSELISIQKEIILDLNTYVAKQHRFSFIDACIQCYRFCQKIKFAIVKKYMNANFSLYKEEEIFILNSIKVSAFRHHKFSKKHNS